MAIHCEWRPVIIDQNIDPHSIALQDDSLQEYLSSVKRSPPKSILSPKSITPFPQNKKAYEAPLWLSYLVGVLEHPDCSHRKGHLEHLLTETTEKSKGEQAKALGSLPEHCSSSKRNLPKDQSHLVSMSSDQLGNRSAELPTTDFHITTRKSASRRRSSLEIASISPKSPVSDSERSTKRQVPDRRNSNTQFTSGIRQPLSPPTEDTGAISISKPEQIYTGTGSVRNSSSIIDDPKPYDRLKLENPSETPKAALKMHRAKSLSLVSSDYELRNRPIAERDSSSNSQTSPSPSPKLSRRQSQMDILTGSQSDSPSWQKTKKRKVVETPDSVDNTNLDDSSPQYPEKRASSARTSKPSIENEPGPATTMQSTKRRKGPEHLQMPIYKTKHHVALGTEMGLVNHTLNSNPSSLLCNQIQKSPRPETEWNSSTIVAIPRKLPSLRSQIKLRNDFQDFVKKPKREVENDTIEVKPLNLRRRGRPRKLASPIEMHIKRRVGRPRKLTSAETSQRALPTQQRSNSWGCLDKDDVHSFSRSRTRKSRHLFERNPSFGSGLNSRTRYHPASHRDTSAASSPRRNLRGGGASRRRGTGNIYGGGRGKGKPRGRGGRGDSPEPPQRNGPLSADDRILISTLKARQQELKKFFSVVGSQQAEVLEQISGRDLNKLTRKARAHRTVPEYEVVIEDVAAQKEEILALIESRYMFQIQHEMEVHQKEKSLVDQQFKIRCENAQKEHIEGAQGDLILLRRAREAANDDTRTQSGSEADYFPYYHELPEPDAQIRGYYSTRITDEKPFKQYLLSYDDQARREVIDEDLINPMAKAVAERNEDWMEETERKKTQNLNALSVEASKELDQIKTHATERYAKADGVNAYALSALADVSEWMSQQQSQQAYTYVPQTPSDKFPPQPLIFTTPPNQRSQSSKQNKRNTKIQSTTNGLAIKLTPALAPAPGPMAASRTISQGIGQPIAPAPPKRSVPIPHSPVFRRSPGHTPAPNNRQSLPGQQRFVFQPPQQPLQHQSAPGPISNTASTAGQSFMGQITQQAKMPVTFVNQTVASRKASAAAAANGSGQGGAKGGQRILLPKV